MSPQPEAAAQPLVQIEGLAFGHRGRALGAPVDLDVRAGEIVALLGPNGCGKTTFLRSLLGLLPALAGRVRVGGRVVLGAGQQPERATLARHLAYVPQAHAGVFAYRVIDVVLMGRAPHVRALAQPTPADREIARQALLRLGVAHLEERPYTEVSGGERQLVLIARALAQQAAVLVMDEPTASLDFGNQRLVLREIAALRQRGVAVLLSTHQPEHALRIADRVALMGAGRLQALGATARTVTAQALSTLYGVPADEVARSVPGLAPPATPEAAAASAPAQPDYAQMYRDHMRHHHVRPKTASAWDARARDYGRNGARSRYVEDFIARMDLRGARSVLDVGCGPGTLALPLARRVAEVVTLDYSTAMLDQLRELAARAGLDNVRALHRAWEDDWSDVPVCDIAIASRSTTVDDLDAAIDKLHRHARLRAYMTVPAHGRFIDPEILELLDADAPLSPSPLWVLGMLERRGVQPRLDRIETPSRLAGCADFDEFARRVSWSAGALDDAARERLRRWWDADPRRARAGGAPMHWAFISWSVARD